MKRDDLRKLEISEEAIDKIMDWNMADIGKEKAKTDSAKSELADVQSKLEAAQSDIDALKASNGDAAKVQQQLDELKLKYDTDTADLKGQISARDYSDAITRAISEKGLKFSSKSAQTAFIAALKEKQLELKDGALSGIDDFIAAQKEADPDAFAPDKPAPRFATGSGGAGGHGNPNQNMTTAELMAQTIGKASANSGKAANNILSSYLGGNTNGT